MSWSLLKFDALGDGPFNHKLIFLVQNCRLLSSLCCAVRTWVSEFNALISYIFYPLWVERKPLKFEVFVLCLCLRCYWQRKSIFWKIALIVIMLCRFFEAAKLRSYATPIEYATKKRYRNLLDNSNQKVWLAVERDDEEPINHRNRRRKMRS